MVPHNNNNNKKHPVYSGLITEVTHNVASTNRTFGNNRDSDKVSGTTIGMLLFIRALPPFEQKWSRLVKMYPICKIKRWG